MCDRCVLHCRVCLGVGCQHGGLCFLEVEQQSLVWRSLHPSTATLQFWAGEEIYSGNKHPLTL